MKRLTDRLVRDNESGCWRWTGTKNDRGYGQMYFRGKNEAVHRVAYILWVGPIPEGLEIDHVAAKGCRYRDCCEPTHLEAVTHAENLARVKEQRTHCKNGHEFTPENTTMQLKNGYWCRRCRACRIEWHAKYREQKRRQRHGG